MKWWRGKIARALAESFISLAVFSVASVVASFYLITTVSNNYASALTRTSLALLGAEIKAESLGLSSLATRYISTDINTAERQDIQKQIANHRLTLDRIIEQAVDQTIAGDLKERTQLALIQQGVVDFYLQINRLIRAYEDEGVFGPRTSGEMNRLINEYQIPLEARINAFQQYEAQRVNQVQNYVQHITRILLTSLIGLSFIAIVFTTLVIGWSFQRIIIPLGELHSSVEQLRQGRLDYPVKVYGRDEVGLLA